MTVLSDAFHAKAREIIARYPRSRSALIMLLHEAQDELCYLSDDAMREVGDVLGLTSTDVAGVATFYTMFKREHPGKYLISVCTNLSCTVNGAEDTADALREVLGEPHVSPADGVCSWESVECLATCHWAVAAQVNYRDIPKLTPDRARQLVEALKSGKEFDAILEDFRKQIPAEPEPAAETTDATTSQRSGDADG